MTSVERARGGVVDWFRPATGSIPPKKSTRREVAVHP
jgi:hypothetical protein